jgi:hypothetical protein
MKQYLWQHWCNAWPSWDDQKKAFDFVVQGSERLFWENVSTYYSDEATKPSHYMAHACITSIGLNSSPQAFERLVSLRNQVGKGLTTEGAPLVIAEGVYNYRMIEKCGLLFFFDDVLRRGKNMDYIEKWKRTKEGNEWWDWAITTMGLKPHSLPIPVEE